MAIYWPPYELLSKFQSPACHTQHLVPATKGSFLEYHMVMNKINLNPSITEELMEDNLLEQTLKISDLHLGNC